MRHLGSLNKYFWKYKWLFLLGIVFIILSNYFRILSPQVTKYVLNIVEASLQRPTPDAGKATTSLDGKKYAENSPNAQVVTASLKAQKGNYDPLVKKYIIEKIGPATFSFKKKIIVCGI